MRKLVQNGRSDYQIVVSAEASEVERYAADELQTFLQDISGVRLPIIDDTQTMTRHEILLGRNAHLERLPLSINFSDLGNEGFVLRTEGDYLVIAGSGRRGTMYGVYTFLEDYLGCRWYSSTASRIPRQTTIRLPFIDDRHVPVLAYREVYYSDAMDPELAGRLKLNGNASTIVDNRMVSERHAGWASWCHTSFAFVPPETYFEEHPAYYGLNDGQRIAKQLCFTNPDLFDIIAAKIREINQSDTFIPSGKHLIATGKPPIWADQENIYIDFSQQDHYGACDCERCVAVNEREGSRIGPILELVNRLAEAFPEKTISTLSYAWSRTPPRQIKPADNVAIMLCNFEATRATPMVDSLFGQDEAFMRDVRRWSEICSNLFIWDYVVDFSHLMMPNPNLFSQQKNIQFFVDNHAKGVFSQGSREAGGEFCELRTYLLAKLLWNPRADADAIIDDFVDGYYGPAGRPIRQYIDLLQKAAIETKTKLEIYDSPQSHGKDYLSEDRMQAYQACFDRAESLVADQPALLHRVRTARMPLMYVEIMNHYGSAEARLKTLEAFSVLCRENGLRKLAEGGTSPDEFHETQFNLLKQELGITANPQIEHE